MGGPDSFHISPDITSELFPLVGNAVDSCSVKCSPRFRLRDSRAAPARHLGNAGNKGERRRE
jgi:hypothetical protein